MKSQIKSYWDGLNDRERWVLGVGVLCCLIYFFYLAIYSPLTNAVAMKSLQLSEKQETLVWMQHVRQDIKSGRGPQTLTSSKLLTVLDNQLGSVSFKQFPYKLHQTAAGDIQLVFERVPYNPFINWLFLLNERYAVTIKQLNVEKTDSAGIVKVMLIAAVV